MPTAGQKILAADFPTAVSDEESTDETAFSNTSYSGGTTPCGVAFVAPTSGRVRVDFYCFFESNAGDSVFVSAAVREGGVVGSGTAVLPASDARALTSQTTGADTGTSMARFVSGLTAGDTYNAQIEFRTVAGTGDIFNRTIMVVPLP